MRTFEYKLLTGARSAAGLPEPLASLGAEGWQVVAEGRDDLQMWIRLMRETTPSQEVRIESKADLVTAEVLERLLENVKFDRDAAANARNRATMKRGPTGDGG